MNPPSKGILLPALSSSSLVLFGLSCMYVATDMVNHSGNSSELHTNLSLSLSLLFFLGFWVPVRFLPAKTKRWRSLLVSNKIPQETKRRMAYNCYNTPSLKCGTGYHMECLRVDKIPRGICILILIKY